MVRFVPVFVLVPPVPVEVDDEDEPEQALSCARRVEVINIMTSALLA
jgi:hypothetical protein